MHASPLWLNECIFLVDLQDEDLEFSNAEATMSDCGTTTEPQDRTSPRLNAYAMPQTNDLNEFFFLLEVL
jgi:hypothetical protein